MTEKISELDNCPNCGKLLSYKLKGKTYSYLVGIEVRGLYDGVSFWQCPHCEQLWDRWTNEKVDKLPQGY